MSKFDDYPVHWKDAIDEHIFKRVCECKIPEPRIKNSENGISSYCNKCSKTITPKQ
jgi:hypothetical protein